MLWPRENISCQGSAHGMLHHLANHRDPPCASCCVFLSPGLWMGRTEGQRDSKKLLRSNSGCPGDNLPVPCMFLPHLSLIPPSPIFSSFLPAPDIFCPRVPMLLAQCPTALPTSPRRCDLYLDSHIRCRGSGVGRPGWVELDLCLSSPSTWHPMAFICHRSKDTVTESCPSTRVAYSHQKQSSCCPS